MTVGRVMNLAAKAGLPKPKQNYLAHALGTNEATPLQVASAYTAFAQEGERADAHRHQPRHDGRRARPSPRRSAQKNEVMRPRSPTS